MWESHTKLLETLVVRGKGTSDLASLAGRRGRRASRVCGYHPTAQALLSLSMPKEKDRSQVGRKPLLSVFRLFVIEGSMFSAFASEDFRNLKQIG